MSLEVSNLIGRGEMSEREIECCPGVAGKLAWVTEVLIRIVLMIIFGLSALVIKPFLRYVQPQDWHDHNFPHSEPESISPEAVFVAIVLAPLLLVTVTLIYGECVMWPRKYLNNKRKTHRRACSEFTVFLLAITMGYLLCGVFTDVIKNMYGRPRPDFLSRCFTPPDWQSPDGSKSSSNKWLTLPSKLNPESNTPEQIAAIEATKNDVIPFPYIEDIKPLLNVSDCINQDEKLLRSDGRRSFPSGHTSFSFAGATICALYSIYWLRRVRTSVRLNQDFPIPGQSLGIVVFFLFYVPAIWVAISRTQDYRHFATDTIAGAIIGTFSVYLSFINYYEFSLLHPLMYSKIVQKNTAETETQHSPV